MCFHCVVLPVRLLPGALRAFGAWSTCQSEHAHAAAVCDERPHAAPVAGLVLVLLIIEPWFPGDLPLPLPSGVVNHMYRLLPCGSGMSDQQHPQADGLFGGAVMLTGAGPA